jgi:hypothetical protein
VRSIEALWGPNGAKCIDWPRRMARLNVEKACGRTFPLCSPPVPPPGPVLPPAGWDITNHVVTANP